MIRGSLLFKKKERRENLDMAAAVCVSREVDMRKQKADVIAFCSNDFINAVCRRRVKVAIVG